MSSIDFCDRLSDLFSGVCAILAIYDELAELENGKSVVDGLFYVVNHLYDDMKALQADLEQGIEMECQAAHPAPSGDAPAHGMRCVGR